MFEIKTFFELHSYEYTDPYYVNNPEAKYIPLEDASELKGYFDHRKFTPEHIQMLITIKYQNIDVVGIGAPSGLDLWNDYLTAIEEYLDEDNVSVIFATDPILLKFESKDDKKLEFSIQDEWEPVKVYAQALLPEEDFFDALLTGAEQFWNTLKNYRVFEEKEIRESTPKNIPDLRIEQIQVMRKKIKTLWK